MRGLSMSTASAADAAGSDAAGVFAPRPLAGVLSLLFAGLGLGMFTAPAMAQAESDSGLSQSQGGSARLIIQPRVSVNQTWTDNNRLSTEARDAALITTVSPGVSISTSSARLRAHLDYSLSGVLYVKSEENSRPQQSLSARANAELIENLLFLDASASIAQQTASAFGQRTVDASLANLNRREVASLSVAPALRGRIGGLASYEFKLNAAASNTKDSIVGDSRTSGAALRINGASRGALSWWSSANTQKSHFRAGVDSRNTSANVGLNYRPDIDWQFGALVGHERSNYRESLLRDGAIYGLNASWTPSVRTKVSADFQSHDYGDSHTLSVEHRLARSALRFSDTQSVSVPSGQDAATQRSNYDLYFFLFASRFPDPVQRDVEVRNFLRSSGQSPDASANGGFLSAGPTLLRSQLLSWSIQGVRTTVTVVGSRSDSRRLASAAASAGDLALSSRIKQRGLSVNVSHALTPTSNAVFSASQQESESANAALSTVLRSISASWSSRLGERTSLSLGARASHFSGQTPYRENAVFANLVQQF